MAKGQRTAVGRAWTDQVEGFRTYIATAEADQLRFEEGEDIFSKYLPWAVLFGLADRWVRVCEQAIALGRIPVPTGYWYGGGWNPNVAKIPLKKAVKEGIVLTAWHAVPAPGPVPAYNIFYNVTSDSNEVSRMAALYAVAKSNGTAKVLIFTDSLYQIALDKANAMKKVIEQCSGCQVVEFIDTPLADTSNRMPGMTYSLMQKYGDKFEYSLAINDLYFDFMAPALQTAGKGTDGKPPYNISAGDGSVTAYQRVRDGKAQVATVPEPLKLHGWQLLDEFNRAFAEMVERPIHEILGHLFVATRKVQRHHAHTILVALQVTRAVERLQRVGGVVLERAKEGGEAELVGVSLLKQRLNELERVLIKHRLLVVALLDQVLKLLLQVVEVHRVLVDVLQEVLPCGLTVGIELNLAFDVVQVQLRVERVVVQSGIRVLLFAGIRQRGCCQNFSNPSRTRSASCGVPSNSNLYICGTWHFAEMMSPAMQYA